MKNIGSSAKLLVAGAALSNLALGCAETPTIVVQPLRVINWSPGSGAICVDTGFDVHVTFSDDIVVDTINDQTLQLLDSGGPVAVTSSYDKTTFTVALVPDQALDYGRLYNLVAKTGIEGASQGPLPVELGSSDRKSVV